MQSFITNNIFINTHITVYTHKKKHFQILSTSIEQSTNFKLLTLNLSIKTTLKTSYWRIHAEYQFVYNTTIQYTF